MNHKIIDFHIDTFSVLVGQNRSFMDSSECGQADFVRLSRGGVIAAICALSADSVNNQVDINRQRIFSQIDLVNQTVKSFPDKLVLLKKQDDFNKVLIDEKLGLLIHLEGCQIIDEDFQMLKELFFQGLRSLSLTWNEKNSFATSGAFNQEDELSPAGIRLTRKAIKLGILIDVAHLNRPGFWSLVENEIKPIYGSHCACQAVTDREYDLDDQQIQAIAEVDGLIAIHFVKYIGRTIDDVIKNILHVVDLVGADYAAIGSDYDGAEMVGGLQSPDKLGNLIKGLQKAGLTDVEIEKICWQNFQRLFGNLNRDL